MEFFDKAREAVERTTVLAFETCRGDPDAVRGASSGKTLAQWHRDNLGRAALCASGALVPGPVALAALAVEIPLLLNLFYRSAIGVGWIMRGRVQPEDYDNILALWAGEQPLDRVLHKSVGTHGALALGAVAPKLTASMSASAATTLLSMAAAKKGSVTTMSYLAARKFAGHLIAKLPARFVPVLGCGAAVAVNVWFVRSIMKVAEDYFLALDR